MEKMAFMYGVRDGYLNKFSFRFEKPKEILGYYLGWLYGAWVCNYKTITGNALFPWQKHFWD